MRSTLNNSLCTAICGALRDLVPFAQFKKREKHPWKSVNFSKVASFKPATLLKLTLPHGYFSLTQSLRRIYLLQLKIHNKWSFLELKKPSI